MARALQRLSDRPSVAKRIFEDGVVNFSTLGVILHREREW